MTRSAPRYIATFRPGSPEMVVVSILAVLGAGFAAYVARVLRAFDCENSSGCSTGGLIQVLLAYAGLGLAVGMLVASARPRGHPWRWFVAALPVYAIWGLFLLEASG